jgi:peptidoglycan/xylan/chitin deacetylase (PgdA/CDA1 family)
LALVPILMYHEVQDPARPNPSAPPSWTVDIDSFRQQMERLRSAGYTGMSVSRWLAERPIQRCRPVVLTFDDGLRGNIDHALPVLLEMGWTATFFITTAMIGNEGYGAPDEWRDASDKGMDIASHGVTHTPLGALDSESALGELMHSRNVLETAVGIPVVGWSWPHGDIPPDGIAMLQTSGYQWAATSREALARDGEAPFSLPRLPIRSWHTADSVAALVSSSLLNRMTITARYRAKSTVKSLLGRGRYAKVQRGLRGDSDAG